MKVCLTLFAVCAAVISLPERTYGGVSGDPELLRLVANGHKANAEKIQTWKGSLDFTVRHNLALPSDTRESYITIRFAADRQRHARLWHFRYSGFKVVHQDGTERTNEEGSKWTTTHSGLVKDGATYRYRANVDPQEERVLAIRDASVDHMNHYSNDIDPFFFMEDRGSDVGGTLLFYYSERENPELDVEVRREGAIVTVETRTGDTWGMCKFDTSKGYNLVESEIVWDVGGHDEKWRMEWEWEERAGVFVPVRFRQRHDGMRSDPEPRKTYEDREFVFTEQDINVPIGEEEFSLEALGIRAGDRVVDYRTGIRYTHGRSEGIGRIAGELELEELEDWAIEGISSHEEPFEPLRISAPVPRESEPPASTAPAAGTQRVKAWLWVLAGSVLAIVVASVIMRRRRRARGHADSSAGNETT